MCKGDLSPARRYVAVELACLCPPCSILARQSWQKGQAKVKRERIQQVILGIVGLVFIALIYPLVSDLWHAKWLVQMNDNECEPMFLSFFVVLGLFLLLAAKKPSGHRSLIAFAAWWSLFHATVMAVQTIEAWNRGIHRDFTDVVIAGIIGAVLLAVTPTERELAAHRGAASTVAP